jgi:hypothetical protein
MTERPPIPPHLEAEAQLTLARSRQTSRLRGTENVVSAYPYRIVDLPDLVPYELEPEAWDYLATFCAWHAERARELNKIR